MNNLSDSLQKENKKRRELLELQQKYENGEILEESLSEEQKIELEKLYDEQIQKLDEKIKEKKYELKQKIHTVNTYYKEAIKLKSKGSKK